jgi:hypothetical protein
LIWKEDSHVEEDHVLGFSVPDAGLSRQRFGGYFHHD